ncbi:hypothetical protein SAMD00019534_022220 [Acytostelium subglobosum LB1]|uniref:hypothetical protein n=1 Tax=Acytostelium subglobosum LB1 TaxID=1410327 RepID=UPI000644F5F2|nr:hypothetical protein SAMD00019534_022220 [Acytostelium subglobosum LB1]GAM19047.1 hypothetical protein SAMD00019534_022220 [Acytostelium subglobosum LB1]|eukprot:XP_012756974.1 hypothetical protein SAMD00019534_022220 [Acytostelium subglobosum LB1]
MVTKLLTLPLLLVLVAASLATAQSEDQVRAELVELITNVTVESNAIYNLQDTYGNEMQCAKIIQIESYFYIGVYHYPYNGNFIVGISKSNDLIHWQQTSVLEFGSSQATVYRVDNDTYLMAWEQTYSTGNHIRIRYYSSLSDLLSDHSSSWVDIPPPSWVEAGKSIGTPNIFTATVNNGNIYDSTIIVGNHYGGEADRQSSFSITNLNVNDINWMRNPNTYYPHLEDSVLYWLDQESSNPGNIGGRDAIQFKGYDFAIIEGNPSNTGNSHIDFAHWQVFLYDRQTFNADVLAVRTPCEATAWANPHFTLITLPNSNKLVVLTTLFIPSEGAGSCPSSTLIYYNVVG